MFDREREKELIKLQELRSYYKEAEKVKSDISSLYKDAVELTFPSSSAFYDISNEVVNSSNNGKSIFNDMTIEVSETLANQMELSLTKSGDNWASFSTRNPLEEEELEASCRKITKDVFDFIHESNFQKNVSQVYRDLIIGTSAMKMTISGGLTEKKLIFKHMNIGRCCFLEDGNGDVAYTFYKVMGSDIKRMETMVGRKVSPLAKEAYIEEDGSLKKINYFEIAMPYGDKGNFMYYIVDEKFNFIFYKKELKYNPFIVTRFNKRNDISVWGVGKAIERLSLMRTLQFYSKRRMSVVDRDTNPPYLVTTGNLKQPEINVQNGEFYFFPKDTVITPLFSNINLQQLSVTISELEAQLKQAFLIDSILEAQAKNTYKSATEIEIANTKFLDKFATYASAISDELPKQIFERAHKLLFEEKLVKSIPKKGNKIIYNNPVIANAKTKEVDKFIQITQSAIGTVGQENYIAQLKVADVVPWLVSKYSGDSDLFKSQKETQDTRNQINQAKQEQAQGENAGQPVASPGGGQIESQNIAEGVGY